MSDRLNKTSICSIIFLDIIAYSQKPVFEQEEYKERFNAQINAALNSVAADDRIILDTGDGAAITLMGEPEEALFVALRFRDGILSDNKAHPGAPLEVRIGINLGPVRVVKDINDRLNVIGDGINVAQRVMNFSESNQILVSRSYYEIVSRLTKEMTAMFSYSGIKQDKHVREHEVYIITPSGSEPGVPPGAKPSEITPTAGASKPTAMPKQSGEHARTPILIVGVVAVVAVVAIVVLVLHLQPAGVPAASAPVAATPVAPTPAADVPLANAKPEAVALPAAAVLEPAPLAAVPAAAAPGKAIAPAKTVKAAKATAKPALVAEPSEQDMFMGADNSNGGGGYHTQDEHGQQVILYGSAAHEARARDRAKNGAK